MGRRRGPVMVALLLLPVLVLGPASPAAADYGPAEVLFELQDPAITESSGVTPAPSPAVLFTHNDSGDGPRFFAIGDGGATLTTYSVEGASASDWEGMARGPGRDCIPSLFLGDIGDNLTLRPFVTVYEVAEPAVSGDGAAESVPVTATHRLVYPGGPADAEALLVDPRSGRLVIVTKSASGISVVYLSEPLPLPSTPAGTPSLMQRVATIDLRTFASPAEPGHFSPTSRLQVTGGEFDADGGRLVLRTYVEAFEWALPDGAPAERLAAGLATPPLVIDLPQTRQGEAVSYTGDGSGLLTTTEIRPSPVHLVPGTG